MYVFSLFLFIFSFQVIKESSASANSKKEIIITIEMT